MATKARKPKLHQWQNGEKNPGRTQAPSLSSPLANERTVYDYDPGSVTGQKSDWSCRWGRHFRDAPWLGPGADPPSSLDMAGVHLTSENGETGWHFSTALSSRPGVGPSSDLDTAWIWRTAVNLGISRETNINVDAILLMMEREHQDLWEVFPVPAGLIYAA